MLTINRDERAFLEKARITAPYDLINRLIWADYLEERGDSRGELIRLQAELKDLIPKDGRYEEVHPRERVLHDDHSRSTSLACFREYSDYSHITARGLRGRATFELNCGIPWWKVESHHSLPEDLIAAAVQDGAKERCITAANFDLHGEVIVNTELLIYNPNFELTSEAIVKELEEVELRPAIFEELLAFGEHYPYVQYGFQIVALGSSWVNPDGDRDVPCLGYWGARRELSLDWWDVEWGPDYRFLAVRK